MSPPSFPPLSVSLRYQANQMEATFSHQLMPPLRAKTVLACPTTFTSSTITSVKVMENATSLKITRVKYKTSLAFPIFFSNQPKESTYFLKKEVFRWFSWVLKKYTYYRLSFWTQVWSRQWPEPGLVIYVTIVVCLGFFSRLRFFIIRWRMSQCDPILLDGCPYSWIADPKCQENPPQRILTGQVYYHVVSFIHLYLLFLTHTLLQSITTKF